MVRNRHLCVWAAPKDRPRTSSIAADLGRRSLLLPASCTASIGESRLPRRTNAHGGERTTLDQFPFPESIWEALLSSVPTALAEVRWATVP